MVNFKLFLFTKKFKDDLLCDQLLKADRHDLQKTFIVLHKFWIATDKTLIMSRSLQSLEINCTMSGWEDPGISWRLLAQSEDFCHNINPDHWAQMQHFKNDKCSVKWWNGCSLLKLKLPYFTYNFKSMFL